VPPTVGVYESEMRGDASAAREDGREKNRKCEHASQDIRV
jgi:hypothetical protein